MGANSISVRRRERVTAAVRRARIRRRRDSRRPMHLPRRLRQRIEFGASGAKAHGFFGNAYVAAEAATYNALESENDANWKTDERKRDRGDSGGACFFGRDCFWCEDGGAGEERRS